MFVCNTTIKPMPEDKQNQWWKIISAHTVYALWYIYLFLMADHDNTCLILLLS